jgi:hypothetical protein
VKWTKDGLEFGGKKYDAATHLPILIFPNPLNPRRYVVLNSGFTFNRAAASGTNSLQTPKVPDWAIVDTPVPPDDKFPGKIVDAGFFDEQWRFTTERPKQNVAALVKTRALFPTRDVPPKISPRSHEARIRELCDDVRHWDGDILECLGERRFADGKDAERRLGRPTLHCGT